MPDLTDYFNPYSRTSQALAGAGQSLPAGPINPNPRPRSLFDDPSLQDLAGRLGRARLGTGRPSVIPSEVQPLFGGEAPAAPAAAPGEAPLAAALKSPPAGSQLSPVPGGWTMDEVMGRSAAPASAEPPSAAPSGPPAMQMFGGAAPRAPASQMDQFMQMLGQGASINVPEFQAPHKWSVGPVRRFDETQAQANARDDADYAGRLGAAVQAQQAAQFGATAQLQGHNQAVQGLIEAQRGQREDSFKQQQLGMEQQKIDLAKAEAEYNKGPLKEWDKRHELARAQWMAQNLTQQEMAEREGNFQKVDPRPTTSAGVPFAGQAGPTSTGGGRTSQGGQAPAAGGPSTEPFQGATSLPANIIAMMTKVKDEKTNQEVPREKDPGKVLTEFYQQTRTNPALADPSVINRFVSSMYDQYGKDKVDQWFRDPSVMGGAVPTERAENLMNRLFGTGEGVTAENAARHAFKTSLGLSTGDRRTEVQKVVGAGLNPFGHILNRILGQDR